MFGKKDKVENKETTKEAKKDDVLKYIILGYGYRQYVYSYDKKDDLLKDIKNRNRITFTRLVNESNMAHGKLRDCVAASSDASYKYDYDWLEAADEGNVISDRAYVPFNNKDELDLTIFDNSFNYKTVKKIYKSIIEDIKEIDKIPGYEMVDKGTEKKFETIPFSLKSCTWSLDNDEITDKNMTANNYAFCTVDKVPENLFYYLDDTPCNELDPIDVSILLQGESFSTWHINILCDFKKTCQDWLNDKKRTTQRIKDMFGDDVCE